MLKLINRNVKAAITLCFIAIFAGSLYGASRPAQWAVAIEKKGLGNFYKVSDDLYRGKQPTTEGIAELKKMGIKTIINLQTSDTDKDLFGDIEIGYEQIPMRASHPKEEDIVKFLKIVTDKQKTPVFVHCQRGADRTGFMCAIYRIAVCGWSKEAAIDEMIHGGYHFSPLCHNLADFINKLDIEKIKKEANIKNPAIQSMAIN